MGTSGRRRRATPQLRPIAHRRSSRSLRRLVDLRRRRRTGLGPPTRSLRTRRRRSTPCPAGRCCTRASFSCTPSRTTAASARTRATSECQLGSGHSEPSATFQKVFIHTQAYFWFSLANSRNGDPSRPCNSDWKKYGKQFSGALAHSYSIAPKPGTNGTTSAATNFQRPLPQRQAAPPPQQHYGGGGYGGGYGGGGYGGGGFQPQFRPAFGPPPGALVLQPGDPRIGGQ